MLGATTISTLLGGASLISPEVRAAIANAIAGDPAGQLGAMTSRVVDFAHGVTSMASAYTGDNTPLVGFGILALFLTIMMTRS